MTEVTYPRNIRLTFHMTHGDPIQSDTITLDTEDESVKWGTVLRDQKNAGHYAVPVTNGIGVESTVFINPNFVMAVSVTGVES
jgi:hypothetical protein